MTVSCRCLLLAKQQVCSEPYQINSTQKGTEMNQSYIAYHSAAGYALLSLKESIMDQRAVVGSTGKQIDLYRMKSGKFEKDFIKVATWRNREDKIVDPKVGAMKLLEMNQPITKSALGHIERVLGMDTRGKSTEQIRAEIVRLSGELPKGHALRTVPKFADRGQAIAAFTAIRQTIFNLSKENEMAKVTKAAVKPEPKAKKEAAVKVKKDKVDLTGPFKLTDVAIKAKVPESLRLHEGSSRYTLMDYAFKNAGKKAKGFTIDDFKSVVGDQTKQALTGMVRYGFIESVK